MVEKKGDNLRRKVLEKARGDGIQSSRGETNL